MKLSNIFNINLSTRGGNKLFARIMNKYNVPKEEHKDIRKGITSSSSDSDGIKEYYYGVIYDDMNTFAKDMMAFVNLVEVCTSEYRITHNMNYYGVMDALLNVIDEDTLGIKIIDSEIYYLYNIPDLPISSLPKGNLEEKLRYLYVEIAQMPIEEFEQYINELHKYLIPITKEEYESLI